STADRRARSSNAVFRRLPVRVPDPDPAREETPQVPLQAVEHAEVVEAAQLRPDLVRERDEEVDVDVRGAGYQDAHVDAAPLPNEELDLSPLRPHLVQVHGPGR